MAAGNPEVKVLLVADASGLTREATKADLAMSQFGKSATARATYAEKAKGNSNRKKGTGDRGQ